MSDPQEPSAPLQRKDRRQTRGAFFHWLVGLFGIGAGMLAFLLLASGEVGWTSPEVILLLVFCAAGLVGLTASLVLWVRRKQGNGGRTA